jgi:hypothetical protein
MLPLQMLYFEDLSVGMTEVTANSNIRQASIISVSRRLLRYKRLRRRHGPKIARLHRRNTPAQIL